MIKILIVEDHPMFREALLTALQLARPDAKVLAAETIDQAQSIIRENRGVDIVLLDLSLPGITGFEGLMLLRAAFPDVPLMIVSGLDDPKIVQEAIRLGAAGFVPKSANKAMLLEAITEVLSGTVYLTPELAQKLSALRGGGEERDVPRRVAKLTPAQLRVLQLIRQGKLNKQIAHELGISETTVKAHVSEILHKLNVVSRTQIVIETAHLDPDSVRRGS
jgi:DNA-binding NarL/FixJ family response regulator